jgi:hypothetical protein
VLLLLSLLTLQWLVVAPILHRGFQQQSCLVETLLLLLLLQPQLPMRQSLPHWELLQVAAGAAALLTAAATQHHSSASFASCHPESPSTAGSSTHQNTIAKRQHRQLRSAVAAAAAHCQLRH